jgi:prephenate dehydratase
MKPAKSTKKKASASKAPKTTHNVNVEYVEAIADESIATIMALRALVRQLADELEEARK